MELLNILKEHNDNIKFMVKNEKILNEAFDRGITGYFSFDDQLEITVDWISTEFLLDKPTTDLVENCLTECVNNYKWIVDIEFTERKINKILKEFEKSIME